MTPAEIKKAQEYVDKWQKVVRATELADFPAAKEAATRVYVDRSLPLPKMWHLLDSPVQSAMGQWVLGKCWYDMEKLELLTDHTLVDEKLIGALAVLAREAMEEYEINLRFQQPFTNMLAPFVYATQRIVLGLQGRPEAYADYDYDFVTLDQARILLESLTERRSQAPSGLKMLVKLAKAAKKAWRSQLVECVRDQIFNYHDCQWYCVYDYVEHEQGHDLKQMHSLMDLSKTCGWWSAYDENAILQHRHIEVHYDDAEVARNHNESGPAIRYLDGFELYAIHGVMVPQQVIMQPKSQTIEEIKTEENVEVKRIRIERFGWPDYLEAINAEERDSRFNDIDNCDEALLFGDGMAIMIFACPSTGRIYCTEVPPETMTCQQGHQWLSNGKSERVILAT